MAQGMTPPPWLTEVDVEEAKELLQAAARQIHAASPLEALWSLWDLLALLMGTEEAPSGGTEVAD